MLPLLPFIAGLVAGGTAVKLLRDKRARAGLELARHTPRAATAPGLAPVAQPAADAGPRMATEKPARPAKQRSAPRAARAAPPKTAAVKPAAVRTRKGAKATLEGAS